jgi:DNA-binding response OmpR family regulator
MTKQTPVTVVVVDDAPEVRTFLEGLLQAEGFRVLTTDDGELGAAMVAEHGADIVLLDLMMPGIDGLETCRRIRAGSDAYVIMLTSKRSELDRVVGLTIGADDYVTKPFSGPELMARIRAMLRRPRPSQREDRSIQKLGDLQVDLETREVQLGNEPIALTRIEFALLEQLTRNPRQILTRKQLLERVWGPEWIGEDHLVDVHISKLRRKLGDDARLARYVVTVRGVGYRMGPCCVDGRGDGATDHQVSAPAP